MQALLGKITNVTGPATGADPEPARPSWKVGFKAACVLPLRSKVPEWLKDQVLTVERTVPDPREVGGPGDSIVLTPRESERWLCPLAVTPDVASGELPETLRLRLRWWKDEKPPECVVRANGRTRAAEFAKEGDVYVASVATAAFFDHAPTLPVTFEVTCDKMKAACTVLPAAARGFQKVAPPAGECYRAENAWYAVEVAARAQGGGVAALRETGRGRDHFRAPENLIHQEMEYGGHIDRLRTGWEWFDKMKEAVLTCAGARHEGGTARLSLEGAVDEGQNLRTSVAYTLYDALPLLLIERDFRFHKGKDDGKDKDERPKEPIDEMKPVGLGFRAAWIAERNGRSGSRILCSDGEGLAVIRGARAGDYTRGHHWRMADGWAMAEHPERREYTLYLFDPETRPNLATWIGAHTITLEPQWPLRPVRPEEAVGFALALTAGERCGAGAGGAWVACRAALPEGGVRCAAVARLRDLGPDEVAAFALGDQTRVAPLQRLLIPGLGGVLYAEAEYPGGGMGQSFDVTVAGIGSRR